MSIGLALIVIVLALALFILGIFVNVERRAEEKRTHDYDENAEE